MRSRLLAVTMIIGRTRFNLYLICCLALAVVVGCKSTPEEKKEKQISTLKLHLEVLADNSVFSRTVSVFREKPLVVTVDRSPFLTESEVTGASVVEDKNGWALEIKFTQRGTWLLEQYTTANPGKHIVIFSTFGGENDQARWLGAPTIQKRISNGVLRFTPDASREEADEIVLGLNNLAKQVAKKSKW
jgi:preprotein translocase subunit SecD